MQQKRQADIGELDEDGQRLRVTWRKMHSFIASFTKVLLDTRAKFETTDYGLDEYGKPWTFHTWLGLKGGLIEDQAFRFIDTVAKSLSASDRETIRAEQQRRADEKRAEADTRRKAAEARREERAVEKQAKQLAKEAAKKPAKPAQPEPSKPEMARRKTIAKRGSERLKELVAKGELSVSTAALIAAKPVEAQDAEIAKALAKRHKPGAKPQRKTADVSGKLRRLIHEARIATQEVIKALAFDDVAVRRERVRAYGAAIAAIREAVPDKVAFNAQLQEHGLEVKDPQWRSNAMWLAANWEKLDLSKCPYTNPNHIRDWTRLSHMAKTDTGEVIEFPRKPESPEMVA